MTALGAMLLAPPTTDDLARLRACGITTVLILDSLLPSVPELIDAGFAVHARLDRRGSLPPPVQAAADLAPFIRAYPQVASWRWGNEPNVEFPGLSANAWQDWLFRFGLALPVDLRARVSFPAPSPVGDWTRWLLASVIAAPPGVTLDVHGYGDLDQITAILAQVRGVWQEPLLLTEFNFGPGPAPVDLTTWAPTLAAVRAACARFAVPTAFYFAWTWPTPDVVSATPVDLKDSALEAYLKGLTPMSEAEIDTLGQAAFRAVGDPYDLNRANCRYWHDANLAGLLGNPKESEQTTANGVYGYQRYDAGYVHWKVGEWIVKAGLPPLA